MANKESVINKFIEFMDELDMYINGVSNDDKSVPLITKSEYEQLVELLHSDAWPIAVDPEMILDHTDESQLIDRGSAILEEVQMDIDTSSKKILDFGCGTGHAVKAAITKNIDAIGYDIVENGSLWNNDYLTTDFSKIEKSAPYDIIILHDVLDHCENPYKVMEDVSSLCNEDTSVLITCHPWTGRHGGHSYHDMNKAFVHVVFTKEELEKLGIKVDSQKIVKPISSYRDMIHKAGLRHYNPILSQQDPEKFFSSNELVRKRILKALSESSFPGFQLSLNFVKFTVKM